MDSTSQKGLADGKNLCWFRQLSSLPGETETEQAHGTNEKEKG